jgi:hypothetical protein
MEPDKSPPAPAARLSPSKAGVLGELLTVLYIGGIAWCAQLVGVPYILFPELGALSHDTLKRPHGTWAKAPGMLMLTPILTGAAGTLIAQHFQYGAIPLLLAAAASILIIRLLRSPIAPAISAGVLPVALDVTSWGYPLSLLVGLGLLVVIFTVWRRFVPPPITRSASDIADDVTEETPPDYTWLPYFIVFLVAAALLAQVSGWRFILFPPLVVIGFEMFAHSDVCPWAGRPFALLAACMLSALAGVALVMACGTAPLAAAGSVVVSVLILRLFNLHVPPALAVGLLPFVIPDVSYFFPLAVGIGTLLLVLFFWVWGVFHKRGQQGG